MKMPRYIRSGLLAVLAVPVLLGITACSPQEQAAAASEHPKQPVDVAPVLVTDVTDWSTFTTRLQSPDRIELRPRVTGIIDQVHFDEGSLVREDQLLITLDRRTFAAEVARLEAREKAAQAALDQASMEAERGTSLRSANAISAERADARRFLATQRRAELASVQAELKAARLNLEFTEIRAPISGRISNAFITQGNAVRANDTVLTRLVSTNKVYAYFDIDERSWNSKFSNITASNNLAAFLQLNGEDGFQHQGTLDFIDNTVDPQSGTLRVRATFPVDSAQLRPGAFARIRIAPQSARARVLVPEKTIGTDLNNRFVLAVDENNVLQYRPVVTGIRVGGLRVIESGLEAGDRVAVNGPARVGPGMPVDPRPVKIEAPKKTLVVAGA
ncbi:efflux RND transporter periplasmic adaptor subunit [Spongorhabdus nitratireducens]